MVLDTTFYDLLGVKPEASEAEIKEALRLQEVILYRKIDLYRDGAKYKMERNTLHGICGILCDPDKRRYYDTFGKAPGLLGKKFRENLVKVLELDLGQLCSGYTYEHLETGHDPCPNCTIKIGEKRENIQWCKGCEGEGSILKRDGESVDPNSKKETRQRCDECQGTGEELAPIRMCKNCNYGKISKKFKRNSIEIGKGAMDGQKIVVPGYVHDDLPSHPRDLLLIIKQKPDPFWERENNNLILNFHVEQRIACNGGKVLLDHIGGYGLKIKFPSGNVIKQGTTVVIEGHGMPVFGQDKKGDLYLDTSVQPLDKFFDCEGLLLLKTSPGRFSFDINRDAIEVEGKICI